MTEWHPDTLTFFAESDYASVAQYYELLIEQEPDELSLYWYLGLAYLLNEDEESAQTAWFARIAQSDELEAEQLTVELTTILHQEAGRQLSLGNFSKSWLVRSYIREINSLDIDNIIHLIKLEIELNILDLQRINEFNIVNSIEKSCFDRKEKCIDKILEIALLIENKYEQPSLGIALSQICLQASPNYKGTINQLVLSYIKSAKYKEAILASEKFLENCFSIEDKFFGTALLLKSALSAGLWKKVESVAFQHKNLLKEIINKQPLLELSQIKSLLVYTGYLFYLRDGIKENRFFQNESAKLFYKNIVSNTHVKLPLCHSYKSHNEKKIRIGYIAHSLTSHSVGWLSRWLFQSHDRDSFHISIYQFLRNQDDPFFNEWFFPKVDFASFSRDDVPAIAEKIRDDKVDILIDLDSITLDLTATVMSLKPAPIQATWLGWDASGLPTVDYFIADPFVLPPEADQHYSEKILRLPHTYIAVNGFEVDVPTLRRSDLGIPGDGVVYYSTQTGMKRHPETIRLQLEILKEVRQGYLLIKGLADDACIQEMFLELASDVGIAGERLKFLPMMPTEMIHRANLGIADVVLDTFPYNGATTTLETLWMGIPLVTRVGTQFAARNSYAFLMNAGVTEGIAWTPEEYVQWGIRFGYDAELRLEVAWKLRQSRKNSALWNTKQFTLDMEKAYRTMWQDYLAGN